MKLYCNMTRDELLGELLRRDDEYVRLSQRFTRVLDTNASLAEVVRAVSVDSVVDDERARARRIRASELHESE